MKHFKLFFLALVLLLGTMLAACGAGGGDQQEEEPQQEEQQQEEQEQPDDAAAEAPADFKVAMVTDTGGIDDKSFNQSAWEGMKRFGGANNLEEGHGFKYLQSGDASDYAPNLNALVREDYDLIWAIGFLMASDIKTVATQRPDNQFAIVDMVVTGDDDVPLSNVAHITFKEHEGSFLAGVVAGMHSESNKIGFVGGVEGALIKKFENGFKAGVKMVNPDAEIIVQYAEDFNDESKGQQIANAMYSQGVDVIYHASGGTGIGVFTEAKNRKRNGEDVWVIGVDSDQHEEGMPENVTLTSMIKRVDRAIESVTEQTMSGNFPGGDIIEYGLEDEGVGIAQTQDNVSEEALAAVDEYSAKIKAGEIQVPTTDEEYEEFLASR
ncbi:BMP family lipoprotein [Bacillus alkalicellulosilyticus]|uniref:BMP family lipoprotein n=1 Tax=Alkalihalobacterium alkalicellulosilyticum TaxID=1912214 RepID=UPI00099889A6|nr:BMP family ABC transporter substrate-binding protein [Bacillus alkalicellulosilyticus]